MGVYLSTPKTDKSSEDGENNKLRFGLSSMQGWRSTMEDAVSFFFFLLVDFSIDFILAFSFDAQNQTLNFFSP